MNKITATIMMMISTMMVILMWFSSDFIPVYVNGKYILANQIIRYSLYGVFIIMAVYGFAYLLSEPEKKKKCRRRRR